MKCCIEEICLAVGAALLLAVPAARAELTPASELSALLKLDPGSLSDLAEMARRADALKEIAQQQEEVRKAARRKLRQEIGLSNLPPAALREYFHEQPDQLRSHESRGVTELGRLTRAALAAKTQADRDVSIAKLHEVMASLRNNRDSPVPEDVNLATPIRFLFSDWRCIVGRGTKPASNLIHSAEVTDMSRWDPAPSSFWRRPANIAGQDLYAGFDRERLPNFTDTVFRYDEPKASYGTKGGFEVESGEQEFQVKFGEVNSEPFTARIFHTLGYHVDPTDYAPHLKVAYDRRLFREFNLRKPLTMRIHLLGIPTGKIELQHYRDPFAYVVKAVFRDGRELSGRELKQILFADPRRERPEDFPENFRVEIEASLDYLVMQAANVQPKDLPTENLGPWEFRGLGHEHLRELRGAALLSAWLGWSDSRSDNTRLRVIPKKEPVELLHFFSDLGAGMGGTANWVSLRGEDPNEFSWTFTRPEIVRGPGRMTTPFRIVHFHPIVATRAFREMTKDDARWMARWIGQLTEEQIRAALIASGYDAAEAKLYQEKLVSRRDRMVRDLKLTGEIPLLRTNAPDRQFSFDPSVDRLPSVVLASGEIVNARPSSRTVQRGRLMDHDR